MRLYQRFEEGLVKDAVVDYLQEDSSLAFPFVQVALRESLSFDPQSSVQGGCNGSLRFGPERNAEENKALAHALKLLDTIQKRFPGMPFADLYQLAGAVSLEFCGCPSIRLRYGRRDCPSASSCVVPGERIIQSLNTSVEKSRRTAHRLGLSDEEWVCLFAYSGLDMGVELPPVFDNTFFRELLDRPSRLKEFIRRPSSIFDKKKAHPFLDDEIFLSACEKFADLSPSQLGYHFVIVYTKLSLLGASFADDMTEVRNSIKAVVEQEHCGPLFLRLAFADASTYSIDDNTGGANGSARFENEKNARANTGISTAILLLEPVRQVYPHVSNADLWQLAGAVAVEMAGGPHVDVALGRWDVPDKSFAPPFDRLTKNDATAEETREYFYRMGLNDQEIVCLCGGHTYGRARKERSGYNGSWTANPDVFDNAYFQELLAQPKTNSGEKRLKLPFEELMVADTVFRRHIERYAKDQTAFFSDWIKVYDKVSQLGAIWDGPPKHAGVAKPSNRGRFRVTIPKTYQTQGYTMYEIQMEDGGTGETWRVAHRYNDFVKLQSDLEKLEEYTELSIPPKVMIGNTSAGVVSFRARAFCTYLEKLLSIASLRLSESVEEFLHLNEHRYVMSDDCLLSSAIFQPFKLSEVENVNHNTLLLRFRLPTNYTLGIATGKHIQIMAKIDGDNIMRPYTPLETGKKGVFEIMVKKYDDGVMSKYLHSLHVGDEVDIKLAGKWVYEGGNAELTLIAAGTGLAPMLQIIHATVRDPKDRTSITLVFCNRTEQDILFKALLEMFGRKYPLRFKVVHVLSQPHEGWKGKRGRINLEILEDALPSPSSRSNQVIVCGPNGFNVDVRKMLAQLGHEDEKVHVMENYS